MIASKQYYVDLLINQYAEKPKASDTVRDFVGTAFMNDMLLDLETVFDENNAFGELLDLVAAQLNLIRTYVYNDVTKRLQDFELKVAIRMAILRRDIGDSLAAIDEAFSKEFLSAGVPTVLVSENTNPKVIAYTLNSDIFTENLKEYFEVNDSLPRPTGVSIFSITIVGNRDPNKMFYGFSSSFRGGRPDTGVMNTYASQDQDFKWRRYADG